MIFHTKSDEVIASVFMGGGIEPYQGVKIILAYFYINDLEISLMITISCWWHLLDSLYLFIIKSIA